MVISKLIGGLGNQMFQYAVGRALSLEYGQPLRLDVAGFAGYDLHQGFELQRIFLCSAKVATEAEVRDILGWQFASGIRRFLLLPAMAAFRCKGFVVEPSLDYWPEIMRVPADSYLTGYWQSEKYFHHISEVIRRDFTFKSPLSDINAEIASQLVNLNGVSVHVRRGDYASNPKTTAMHGLCSLDYYQASLRYIAERVDNPYVFIFSDDIAWAKNNLEVNFPCRYISHNQGIESYNDMHLMSLCQHQIIANSSFSWWGAWLNVNPDKIVIAPKKWFSKEINTQDLIPQGWVRL
jgi:hypothetical protein